MRAVGSPSHGTNTTSHYYHNLSVLIPLKIEHDAARVILITGRSIRENIFIQ